VVGQRLGGCRSRRDDLRESAGAAGFPLSATIYHEDLDTWGPGDHAGTYRGHVVGMRAGTRAIEYIQEHDLLAHARDLGEYIRGRLREAANDNEHLADIRGKGLFIGAEFVDSDGNPDGDLVDAIQQYCFERAGPDLDGRPPRQRPPIPAAAGAHARPG